MKDSKRNIYIYEILIFIYLLFSLIFIVKNFITSVYINYIEMLIWLILLIIIFIKCGFPRDKGYFKKLGIRYALIYCLLYLFTIYFLGMFTGFSYSVYSHTIKNLFNNIFPVLIMVISKEIVRYVLCKKSNDNKSSLFLITSIYIFFDLFTILYYYNFNDSEQIFIFICLEFFGIIAKNFLFTYITNYISLIPTIIIALAFQVFVYITPIIPNLGNYLNSVLGIVAPYLLYLKLNKMIKYSEKRDLTKYRNIVFIIPVLVIIGCICLLISGIGKYKMIAIASNSMNPVYNRGDAVIYEKMNVSGITKGDILVFKSDNIVVTHRVVNVIKIGSKIYFQTKGDNNDNNDINLVSDADVYGRVKYIVKYIGYPTVELQELLKK